MTVLLVALSVFSADPSDAPRRVAHAPQGVLLDFTATWCGPCQQMAPIISKLERQGFPVRKVDIDQHKALAQQYNVSSIPCFVLVVNDREVTRITGQTSEAELRRLCAQIPRTEEPTQVADNRGGGSRPAPARILNTSNELPATPRESAEPQKKKGLLGNFFGRREKEKGGNPFDDVDAIRGNNDATSEPDSAAAGNPLTASVRIKVRDAKGLNFGTGSIIISKPGMTLILTCGHLFRGLTEESSIAVDAFPGGKAKTYAGKLVTFDEKSDIGLITIPTEGSLPTVTVAPMTTPIAVGDELYSIGCSAGENPTRMAAQVTGLNRYQGSDNIECTGMPVPGRSGGGLFNSQGEVVGVCWAAYEAEKRGIYTSLKPIYSLLQKGKFLPGGNDAESDLGEPALTADAPKPRGRSTPPRATAAADAFGDLGAFAGEAAIAGTVGEMPEEALVRDAEVVCIIRPKDTKQGTRVVIMHRASNRFLNYLQGEWKAPPKPTAARFPFDPTMNLAANLVTSHARPAAESEANVELARATASPESTTSQGEKTRQPRTVTIEPGFERYQRSEASRR
jgi:thiol-disulfide isomerase/thioredoxin